MDRRVFGTKTKAENRQHLRRDTVDTHSSVDPFGAQSLSQFDHSSFGGVVGKLLLGMGDCKVEGGQENQLAKRLIKITFTGKQSIKKRVSFFSEKHNSSFSQKKVPTYRFYITADVVSCRFYIKASISCWGL